MHKTTLEAHDAFTARRQQIINVLKNEKTMTAAATAWGLSLGKFKRLMSNYGVGLNLAITPWVTIDQQLLAAAARYMRTCDIVGHARTCRAAVVEQAKSAGIELIDAGRFVQNNDGAAIAKQLSALTPESTPRPVLPDVDNSGCALTPEIDNRRLRRQLLIDAIKSSGFNLTKGAQRFNVSQRRLRTALHNAGINSNMTLVNYVTIEPNLLFNASNKLLLNDIARAAGTYADAVAVQAEAIGIMIRSSGRSSSDADAITELKKLRPVNPPEPITIEFEVPKRPTVVKPVNPLVSILDELKKVRELLEK